MLARGCPAYLPKYTQGDANCTRFCARIAAETAMQRPFSLGDTLRFWNWGCPCEGDHLASAVAQFGERFDCASALDFARLPPRRVGQYALRSGSVPEPLFVRIEEIEAALDQGAVLVLSLQNMDFDEDRIVGTGFASGGHSVCCIGHTRKDLVVQDSNPDPHLKTVSKSTLRDAERALHTTTDLEDRLHLMRTRLYIDELYVVRALRSAQTNACTIS